ncbi:MAG: NAD(P)H-hydrate dehydratase [Candidatus Magasanikbacteria bacterium]|nr:NAD(P)H-hydrate dehydratase [Candidatus Magasanikbacteria bacterium]
MREITKDILTQLKKPDSSSHKGQNGRLLIIAGSEKFHGALLLAVETASRIVDMVYVYTTPNNRGLIENLKSDITVFIPVREEELWSTVDIVDSILIGPGLSETDETIGLVRTLLNDYQNKKVVIDATAMWHLSPSWIHSNTIMTPHSREFEQVYKCTPTADHVREMAIEYGGVVVLKGAIDYVSDGKELCENKTGNVGMTKGGTGDVLASTIASFACSNDTMISACAGLYFIGFVGDKLYEKKGTFYNAEDLIGEMGEGWKKLVE